MALGKNYYVHGVIPVLVASTCWGLNYFARKFIVQDIGVLTITFLYCIASTAFLYVLNPSQYRGLWGRFLKRWKLLTIMSILSVTVGMAAMNIGLRYVDLGVATILEKTQTVFAIVIAAFVLHETLSKYSILLGVISLIAAIGLVPIAQNGAASADDHLWLGIGGVTLAAVVWAFSGVMGRKLARDNMNPNDMAMIRSIIGIVVTSVPMFLIDGLPGPEMNIWQVGLGLLGGVLGGALGYLAYYRGLSIISAGVAAILELFTPFVSVILGIVFLNEKMSLIQWLSAGVLLASVTLLVKIESRRHQAVVEANIET